MAMLEVKDLQVYYGVIQALKGISFEVEQGDMVALIGANGAGKTTTLHTITGSAAVQSRAVSFLREQILPMFRRYKLVSNGNRPCAGGTPCVRYRFLYLQNLKMGAYTRNDKNGD